VKVKDLIWREPVKISSNATVSEAIEKMLKKGIRALIVEPKGENETFGILTVRDIVYKVIAKGKNPRDVKVEEIATRPVVTIDSNWSVRDAARLMANLNLARLVVVESGRPIGIVTLMDIMKASEIL